MLIKAQRRAPVKTADNGGLLGDRAVSPMSEIPGFASPPRGGVAFCWTDATDPRHPLYRQLRAASSPPSRVHACQDARPMRILFIAPYAAPGGSENVLINVLERLD